MAEFNNIDNSGINNNDINSLDFKDKEKLHKDITVDYVSDILVYMIKKMAVKYGVAEKRIAERTYQKYMLTSQMRADAPRSAEMTEEIYKMWEQEGITYAQIARTLGISVRTVKYRIEKRDKYKIDRVYEMADEGRTLEDISKTLDINKKTVKIFLKHRWDSENLEKRVCEELDKGRTYVDIANMLYVNYSTVLNIAESRKEKKIEGETRSETEETEEDKEGTKIN